MTNKNTFGETVEGYHIPVLNQREIRASAGIMFLTVFIAFALIMANANFVPIKYVLLIFLVEFSIRLFINPKYAPILIISRFIVSDQTPEYVGAAQKRFAWFIGFGISVLMFFLMIILNTYSPITGIACLICMILMFAESAFGICIGCRIYRLVSKDKAQYCPGEICEIKKRHAIQKTNLSQWLIVIGMIGFVILLSVFLQDYFEVKPTNLFEKFK